MTKKNCVGIAILLICFIVWTGSSFAKELPADTSDRIFESAASLTKAGLAKDRSADITLAMIENNFNEDQVIAVHQIIIKSLENGLDTTNLIGKIFEGLAKNIQPERIVQAVAHVQHRELFSLNQGKQLAGVKPEAKSIAVLYAASLSAGMTYDDAKSITKALVQKAADLSSEDAFNLSMETLGTAMNMSRLGVNSDTLTAVVSKALNSGYSVDDMAAMRHSFVSQARQTQPNQLAHNFAKAIDQGTGFGSTSRGNAAEDGKPGRGTDPDNPGNYGGPEGPDGMSGPGNSGNGSGAGGSGSASGGAGGPSGDGSAGNGSGDGAGSSDPGGNSGDPGKGSGPGGPGGGAGGSSGGSGKGGAEN